MKIEDCECFGKALRERRRKLGYTQAYISEFTGLSVSFLSELENGKSTAELGKAPYVASILGMDCELNPRD